ncbi:MAG: S-layer homology domain-containing protein, partial [Oscillospiraceae bacterium]|nr:S-layer homology domain-containing protein [Oscillospiraceae bacterium]
NITRTEAVTMMYLMHRGSINHGFSNTVRGVNADPLRSWGLSQTDQDVWWIYKDIMLSRFMSPEQARNTAAGEMTRIEVALLLRDSIDPTRPRLNDESYAHVTSANFRNNMSTQFADMGNITNNRTLEGRLRDNPMLRIEQRTGTASMCPQDVWFFLDMIDLGIMSAFPDGTLRPHDPVTRGEFIIYLMRTRYLTAQNGVERDNNR